mgnify:CR=1 FL=1
MSNTTANNTNRTQRRTPNAPRPCKRCNGQPGITQEREDLGDLFRFRVFCPGCDLDGPERLRIGDAIAAWNRRQR